MPLTSLTPRLPQTDKCDLAINGESAPPNANQTSRLHLSPCISAT